MDRFSNHPFSVTRAFRRGGIAAVLAAVLVPALTACSASDHVAGPGGRGPSLAKQASGGTSTLSAVSVSPTTVTGGTSSQGTVTLSAPAGAKGTRISLTSSDPAASVPASVTIPRGQTSATFAITTTPSWGAFVTITASDGRASKSAPLTVARPDLATLALSFTTLSVSGKGEGTLTLTGPAPGNMTIVLVSSHSAASVNATVSIPTGQSSTPFTVEGFSPAAGVVITASLGPTTLTSAPFTVQ
jgi:hypothetical protein